MRLVGGGAELRVPERLVVADVAFEEAHLAVALEGEDVRRDPVEEPAVMADDDDAAGKRLEAGLERPQRVDVEVVGRLVEEQDVAPGLQQLGQVDAVPLAAGQVPDELLLIGAAEVEARDVGARRDLAVADPDRFDAVGDLGEDRQVRPQLVAALVDVAELDGLADLHRPAVGRLLADDHPEQRRLAGTVRADDPDDPGARQRERQVLDQQPVAVPLAQVPDVDDRIAQAGTGRDRDLQLASRLPGVGRLGEQPLVGGQPRLALRLASPGAHPHPRELAGERALPRVGRLRLPGHPLELLLEPARVVAGERDSPPPVQLEDPLGDVVEEVPVMRDGDHRAGVSVEEVLQPLDRLGVEVVRGLVEQQQVGVLEEQPGQGHPALLAA